MSEIEQCYSTNDEDFNFQSAEEVFDDLYGEGCLTVGQVYFEADCVQVAPSDIISASSVIEEISNSLWDEVGEVAEDYPAVTKEAELELQKLLEDWLVKYDNPSRFWRIIGKSRMKTVTVQDVLEYTYPDDYEIDNTTPTGENNAPTNV